MPKSIAITRDVAPDVLPSRQVDPARVGCRFLALAHELGQQRVAERRGLGEMLLERVHQFGAQQEHLVQRDEAPDQRAVPPKNSDIGGHHLAFYVDDIEVAVEYLKGNGIEVLGSPSVRTEGPHGGQTWVYFLAPWGLQLELVSFPGGKAYERDYLERLWHPKYPSD